MTTTTRVLHLPANQASQMALLVQSLRQEGIDASGIVSTGYSMQSHEGLRVMSTDEGAGTRFAKFQRKARLATAVSAAVLRSDIVHWHTKAALPREADMRLATALHKARIIEFHGSEARTLEHANRFLKEVHEDASNPYRVREDAAQYQRHVARFADTAIVPIDLVPHVVPGIFRNIVVRPGLVDVASIKVRVPASGETRPLVVHAASSSVKGTSAVRAALRDLGAESSFRSNVVEGLPRQQLTDLMTEADIYLDQFVLGAPGIAAFEAMAMGKPVVAYIDRDVAARLPEECPIISATPHDLAAKLEPLLASGELRAEIGRKSREYVEQHHDSRSVGARLARLYQDLLQDKSVDSGYLWPGLRTT